MTSSSVTRRRLLTAGLGLTGVAMVGGVGALSRAVARAGQTSSSQIRTGMVVDYSETAISVRFAGGDVNDFPYLRSYEPILGETVLLGANGSAWIVLGGLAGMPPDNPVVNGGFENDGGSVTGWAKVDMAGATTLAVDFPDPAVEGVAAASIASVALNINTVLYSNAIPVIAGEHWSADCYVRASAGGNPGNVIAWLMLTWYANPTNVYPTTAASDTIISLQEIPAPQNIWSCFRPFPGTTGGYAVPAAATHMRVAIQCQATDATQVPTFFIDRVVARQLD